MWYSGYVTKKEASGGNRRLLEGDEEMAPKIIGKVSKTGSIPVISTLNSTTSPGE